MKKPFVVMLLAATVVVIASAFNQDTKGIARVQKILGKEVYVLCEPVREYDVVERLTTSLTTNLVGRSTIQKQMQEVIDRANGKVSKGKMKDYDAALTDDGDVVVLIKFK